MNNLCTRKNYVLVGSDFSAQEVRMTAYMTQDQGMIQAYKEGKDLYAVVASNMYDNKYEDNLEFYPEGTEIEFEGNKVVCGTGKESVVESSDSNLAVPYYKLFNVVEKGWIMAKDLIIGDYIIPNDAPAQCIKALNSQNNLINIIF